VSLGYRSNPYISTLMASLRNGRPTSVSPVIAFLNPRASRDSWKLNVPWAKMFEGASARATALGFKLEEFWLGDPNVTPARISSVLHARGIRAAILAIPESENQPLDIDLNELAAVAIDIDPVRRDLNRVSTDYFGNTMMALQSMRALGYRRVGLAVVDWNPTYIKRLARAALLEFEQELPIAERGGCWIGAVADLGGFAHWLQDRQPDAIVTTHWHPQAWLQSLGFRIGQDIGVGQLDPGAINFPLSCIDGRFADVGAAAVDLLMNQIQNHEFGTPHHPRHILHSGVWQDGWSTIRRSDRRPIELYNEPRLAILQAVRQGDRGALETSRRALFADIYGAPFPQIPAPGAADWRPLSLAPIANCTLRLAGSMYWLREHDRLNLPVGPMEYRGVPFVLPGEGEAHRPVAHVMINRPLGMSDARQSGPATLPMCARVESVFLLQVAFYVQSPAIAGHYCWTYEDGAEHCVPLRPYSPPEVPMTDAAFQDSWSAVPQYESDRAKPIFISEQFPTGTNERFAYIVRLVNPRPNVMVQSLKICPSGESTVVLLVAAATALGVS
jgi:LacI family transcriptional regulator